MAVTHYDDAFFKKRAAYISRVPLMCQSIIDIWTPKTSMDLGAAIGDIVNGFIERGVDCVGIEGSPSCLPYLKCPKDKMLILDLSKPLPTLPKVDLVTCFEVIEHIEPEFVDVLLDNLTQLSDTLVISICCYGPTTKIHPTIKPIEFWLEKFKQRGFTRRTDKEALLKEKWKPLEFKAGVKEPYKNLLIWKKNA